MGDGHSVDQQGHFIDRQIRRRDNGLAATCTQSQNRIFDQERSFGFRIFQSGPRIVRTVQIDHHRVHRWGQRCEIGQFVN